MSKIFNETENPRPILGEAPNGGTLLHPDDNLSLEELSPDYYPDQEVEAESE
jgi:hypothetical protein